MDNARKITIKTPAVILNLKTYYPTAIGAGAVKMAKSLEKEALRAGMEGHVAVAATALDLRLVASKVRIPIFSQHAESLNPGSTTGHVILENVKLAKGQGTLLNHSECRIADREEIRKTIERAKSLGLVTVVCANDAKESEELARFQPDFVAVEPPELIGSGISVSTARPEVVSEAVAKVKRIAPGVKVLCGAGISNGADVRKAVELGADGVLLASYIAKSKTPRRECRDIINGIL